MNILFAAVAAACTYYLLKFQLVPPLIMVGVLELLQQGEPYNQNRLGITGAGYAFQTSNTYSYQAINIGTIIALLVAPASARSMPGWLATLAGVIAGTAAGAALAYSIGRGFLGLRPWGVLG